MPSFTSNTKFLYTSILSGKTSGGGEGKIRGIRSERARKVRGDDENRKGLRRKKNVLGTEVLTTSCR